MNRIIYYYQTFCGLDKLLDLETIPVTHIHISSIHFGINQGKQYIHLNDYPPDSPLFDTVWKQTKELHDRGVDIRLMVGGGGGAFIELFNNFQENYDLLKQTIMSRPWISGIDLDVEESIDIYDLVMLIDRIKVDFGIDFKISLAPVQSALEMDICGFGGFKYKNLMKLVGDKIEYLNGQFYSDFTIDSYNMVIDNGYDPSKIVIGMMSEQFYPTNFVKCLNTIIEIKKKYNNFGGVFVWEFFNAPPGKNPIDWAILINAVMKK